MRVQFLTREEAGMDVRQRKLLTGLAYGMLERQFNISLRAA